MCCCSKPHHKTAPDDCLICFKPLRKNFVQHDNVKTKHPLHLLCLAEWLHTCVNESKPTVCPSCITPIEVLKTHAKGEQSVDQFVQSFLKK